MKNTKNRHKNTEKPKSDSVVDLMISLIYAFQELPQLRRDMTIEIGVHTKVKCKPVLYLRPELEFDLFRAFFLQCIYDKETVFDLDGFRCRHSFMGIEIRTQTNKNAPEYALAFEPVNEGAEK